MGFKEWLLQQDKVTLALEAVLWLIFLIDNTLKDKHS